MHYSQWNSVPEYIIVQLKQLITSGDYKAGDRFLTEKKICEKYNVGRSSVREALMALQTLGFIELQRGRGAFVTRVADDDIRLIKDWYSEHKVELQDIVDIRLCTEKLAIKAAIERITDEQIDLLKETMKDINLAVEQNAMHTLITLDEKFHDLIVDATGNKLLKSINVQIQKAASEYRAKTYSVKDYAQHVAQSHERILEAIINKDVEKALIETEEHITTALVHYDQIIEQ